MGKVFDNTQAFREGWGLFMCDDGLLRVQRTDDRLNDPQSVNPKDAPAFESVEALLQAVIGDSVSPAICMNEDCDFTCEMEPDQDRGYCEECHTNTMKAAPVLAGLI